MNELHIHVSVVPFIKYLVHDLTTIFLRNERNGRTTPSKKKHSKGGLWVESLHTFLELLLRIQFHNIKKT